jgi:hypothetical protein
MMKGFKLETLFILSAVFALGVIVGVSVGTVAVSKKLASIKVSEKAARPAMIDRFKSRLNLSPEQTQRLQTILDETHHQFGLLHQAVKPKFEEIRKRMRSKIRLLLDEEQRREYEAMIRERELRKSKRAVP